MASVLCRPKGVGCRVCGAVAAAPARHGRVPEGVCGKCENKFTYWDGHRKRNGAVTFEMWLAHRLEIELKRVNRTGVSGACEAVSWNNLSGYQCGLPAVEFVEGRRICGIHANRGLATLTFIDQTVTNPFAHITDSLHELATKDSQFRQMLLNVAALLETPNEQMDRFLSRMGQHETEDDDEDHSHD